MTITAGPAESGVDQSAPDANVTGGQGSVAAVNVTGSTISVINHAPVTAPPTYADFIADFNASAPAGRYDLFWSAEDKHRKRSLNGNVEPAEAKRIITRRILDGDGIHVQECADLLHSVNRDRARAILKLMDEDPTRAILVGMADGLGDSWLMSASTTPARQHVSCTSQPPTPGSAMRPGRCSPPMPQRGGGKTG